MLCKLTMDRMLLITIVCLGTSYSYTVAMAEEILTLKAENRSLPGFEKDRAGPWEGPFFFIQGADTQFGMIESYIEKKVEIAWDKEIVLARQAIAAINAMTPRPRFFIICGDLIDAMPGNKYRMAQENDFIRIFKELHPDIPLVCVCGNHDVGNQPTHETIQSYTNKFGDDYFTFYTSGVMFIVLNSQFYKDSSCVTDLAEEQEKWLEEQLFEAKTGQYKHVVIFQHIPWFIKEWDEGDIYFNIDMTLREKMLQKFHDANIRAIFCGHWHGNGGGFYKDLEVVVTSAIGAQLRGGKSGFRVVTLGENAIKHQYYAFKDAPKNITLD